jgi:isochorismate synthase EntC
LQKVGYDRRMDAIADAKGQWRKNFLNQGALFSIGEDVHIFWGDFTRNRLYPHDKLAIYYTDFFLTEVKPWICFSQHLKISRLRLSEIFDINNQDKLSLQLDPPDYADFARQYSEIQEKFESGDLSKAVPMVFSSGKNFSTQNNPDFVEHLISRILTTKDLHLYGIWGHDFSKNIIGATPEVLFQWDQNKISTMALAGTCAATGQVDQDHPLLLNQKEMHEHNLVIEGICTSLYGLGEIACSDTHIVQMSTLEHLRTEIKVECFQNPNFLDLIDRLHPTPALGVYPKNKNTKQFLLGLDKGIHRGPFGAPFGLRYCETKSDCLVAIRGVQWADGKIQLGAGCGVVRDSQLSQEWNEILIKQAAVSKMLDL